MREFEKFLEIMNKQEELNNSYKIIPEEFGEEWNNPIFLCNVYLNNMFVEISELIDSLYFKHWTKEFKNKEKKFYEFKNKNNVFIELVDILHFLMSIYIVVKNNMELNENDLMLAFLTISTHNKEKKFKNNFDIVCKLVEIVSDLKYFIEHQFTKIITYKSSPEYYYELEGYYSYLLKTYFEFLDICEGLGFSLEQIYEGYLEKNKVNHQRRENGYSHEKKDEKDNEEIIKKIL